MKRKLNKCHMNLMNGLKKRKLNMNLMNGLKSRHSLHYIVVWKHPERDIETEVFVKKFINTFQYSILFMAVWHLWNIIYMKTCIKNWKYNLKNIEHDPTNDLRAGGTYYLAFCQQMCFGYRCWNQIPHDMLLLLMTALHQTAMTNGKMILPGLPIRFIQSIIGLQMIPAHSRILLFSCQIALFPFALLNTCPRDLKSLEHSLPISCNTMSIPTQYFTCGTGGVNCISIF